MRHRPRALQRPQGGRPDRGLRRRARRGAGAGLAREEALTPVALLTVELHLHGCRSLKDKRMVLRRVKDRLGKFNVAVAEVEYHDLWQRAALGIVTISTTEAHARQELAQVVDEIERVEPGAISGTGVELLA